MYTIPTGSVDRDQIHLGRQLLQLNLYKGTEWNRRRNRILVCRTQPADSTKEQAPILQCVGMLPLELVRSCYLLLTRVVSSS